MLKLVLLLTGSALILAQSASAQTIFHYHSTEKKLYHGPVPWSFQRTEHRGTIVFSPDRWQQWDTLSYRGKEYPAEMRLDTEGIYRQLPGRKPSEELDTEDHLLAVLQTARYTPDYLRSFLATHRLGNEFELMGIKGRFSGEMQINQLSLLHHDPLYGDWSEDFLYQRGRAGNIEQVIHRQHNGRLTDTIQVSTITAVEIPKTVIPRATPAQSKDSTLRISSERISNHLTLIHLQPADVQVLLVEFREGLFLIDAPLEPRFGQAILMEAGRLRPNKPIRWFAFGHHHGHYLGGIRPLVHAGVEVFGQAANRTYVEYLVSATHTAPADQQSLDPKPLIWQDLPERFIYEDGDCRMEILHIGTRSNHTDDYLIFYFPDEKILFQGDLIWIPQEGEVAKAGNRQKGLYEAIRELNLEVETIYQGWPLEEHKMKTRISMSELEATIQ